jgi:transposase
LADLPWGETAVKVKLQVRRFFCGNDDCKRRIFCEQIPDIAGRYARQTNRVNQILRMIGLIAGGEGGARISKGVGISVSGDTLLRRIRSAISEMVAPLKIVGVDDWAKRKGQSYGTILVDLERHRVIDLLPDREAKTLEEWLKQHPGVEIITRDRAAAYAEGATNGAPEAIQIADRWHLLKNLTEAVERFVQTKQRVLQQAAQQINEQRSAQTTISEEETQKVSRQSKLDLWNKRRQQRYEEVRRLRQEGATIRGIAEHFGMQRRTVRMLLNADTCPERLKPRKRSSQLDRHIDYLAQRWSEGCHNAAELYRELQSRGYRGSEGLVRRFIAQWRNELPSELKRARRGPALASPPTVGRRKPIIPSPRNTA